MYKDTHKKSSFDNIMEQKQDQFWKAKALKEMTRVEWESLCDHCGRCCLHSLQDGNTGKITLLAVACRYLDISSCRCFVYENRFKIDSNCIKLTPDKVRRIKKLPYTCAYRTLVEGRELQWWHPLVSGDINTVHKAGVSVQGKVVNGAHIHPDDLNSLPLSDSI
jgi:uncharacterized cysteine cluster protein YcgN (CxxCxxCC family)